MSYSDIPFPSLPVVVEPLNAPDFNSPGLEGLDDLGLCVLVNGVVLLDEVVVGAPLGQRVLEIVLRNQLTTANNKIITVRLDSTSFKEILLIALTYGRPGWLAPFSSFRTHIWRLWSKSVLSGA